MVNFIKLLFILVLLLLSADELGKSKTDICEQEIIRNIK